MFLTKNSVRVWTIVGFGMSLLACPPDFRGTLPIFSRIRSFDASPPHNLYLNDSKTDAAGNTFLWLSFEGELSLGQRKIVSPVEGRSLVVCLDSVGSVRWFIEVPIQKYGMQLSVNAAGDGSLVGSVTGPLAVGGQTLDGDLNSRIDIVRFNAAGSVTSLTRLVALSHVQLVASKLDSHGTIYLLTRHDEENKDSDPLPVSQEPRFLAIGADGVLQWTRAFESEEATLVSTDRGLYTFSLSNGTSHVLLTKWSLDGRIEWSNDLHLDLEFDASTTRLIAPVGGNRTITEYVQMFTLPTPVVDSVGNFYVAGGFMSRLKTSNGVLQSAGNSDVYVASFTPEGVLRWAQRYGGPESERAVAVTISRDLVVVTGSTSAMSDLGGGSLFCGLSSSHSFVLGLSTSGEHRYSFCLGATDYLQQNAGVHTRSLSTAPDGVYVSGIYLGAIKIENTFFDSGTHFAGLIFKIRP